MRIAMYVDGWNMYHSMKRAGIREYGWCNFELLARQRTGYANAVVSVKFFTSSDKPNPDASLKKQKIWWKALELKRWTIVEGEYRYISDEVDEWLGKSGGKWREKMTDVALASHLIADVNLIEPAFGGTGDYRWRPGYDIAVLLTQDTDFVPAVKIVSESPFGRPVHVLLPPADFNAQENAFRFWQEHVSRPNVKLHKLTRQEFASSLLPRTVVGPRGDSVDCHPSWMCREEYARREAIRARRCSRAVLTAEGPTPGKEQRAR